GVLEEYLEDFNGCVIIVSHDRYFLDRTVDTIFAFEEKGKLRQYPGNYSVYLETKQKELNTQKAVDHANKVKAIAVQVPKPSRSETTNKKLTFKEKKEYETLEAQIPQWEAEKENLEKQLYENPPQDFATLQQLTTQLGELTQKIETGTDRWLELAERL
ncbi:MAG: ABC transporter ATP-binding protein, partial [Microcystaceae cyanobacterium]